MSAHEDIASAACEEWITAKLANQRARRGVYAEHIHRLGWVTCTQTLCNVRYRSGKDYWRTSWLLNGSKISRKRLDLKYSKLLEI